MGCHTCIKRKRNCPNKQTRQQADGTLKILDYGLAKAIPKNEAERQKVRMTGETGSIRYSESCRRGERACLSVCLFCSSVCFVCLARLPLCLSL